MANLPMALQKFQLTASGNIYLLTPNKEWMGMAALALVSNAAVGASITVVARPSDRKSVV